jgi:uncharacterized membrane protein YcaP (DUF421 family)
MWQELLTQQVPLLEKILRAVLVYSFLLVLLRVSGKRALATTNTLDLVVLLVLASTVENALVGEDDSLTGAVISSVTLVAINTALRYLTNNSPRAARILQGKPTTVIQDGHFLDRGLKRLGIRPSELEHAVRSQNGDSVEEIRHGELTPSGQFILSLKDSEQGATKADVAALREQLRRIEDALAARSPGAAR